MSGISGPGTAPGYQRKLPLPEPGGLTSFLRVGFKTHAISLGIACLIWFIASNNINANEEIYENHMTMDVVLPSIEDMGRRFQVRALTVPDTRNNLPSLNVSGPQQRVTELKSELRKVDRTLNYQLRLSAQDLQGVKFDPELHTGSLSVELDRFELMNANLVPIEVSVTFKDPDKQIVVELEEVVDRPVRFIERVTPPEGYRARTNVPQEATATGPWSVMRRLLNAEEHAAIALSRIDLATTLTTPEQVREVLGRATTRPATIEAPEGVTIRNASGRELTDVVVEFILEQDLANQVIYETAMRAIPLQSRLPGWLLGRTTRISSPDDSLDSYRVTIDVNREQREAFNAQNVRVVIDLTAFREADLITLATGPDERGMMKARLDNVPTILEIDDKALQYRLPPGVKTDPYVPLTLILEWQRGE